MPGLAPQHAHISHERLPSTSPAHATLNFEQKLLAWREALAKAGFPALSKVDITGRGRQRGIQVGSALYEELAKVQLMLVVDESKADAAERERVIAVEAAKKK